MRKSLVLLSMVLLVAGFGFAGDIDTKWLNVHVTEADDDTNVEVHLPLNLVLALIDAVDAENFHDGVVDLELDDVEIDWPQVLAAVKEAPAGQYVTVDSNEAKVKVTKENNMILVHATEIEGDNAEVDVRLPLALVDAININEENQLDLKALLESLEQLPDGELVRVTSDEANVRVWIE